MRDVRRTRVIVGMLYIRYAQAAALVNDGRAVALDFEDRPEACFVDRGKTAHLNASAVLRKDDGRTVIKAPHVEHAIFESAEHGLVAMRTADEPVE